MMTLLPRGAALPSVVTDTTSGRPSAVRIGPKAMTVTAIDAVRDETFAYPASTGPRTVFRVRAAGRRYRLIHRHRSRDWSVEALDRAGSELAAA